MTRYLTLTLLATAVTCALAIGPPPCVAQDAPQPLLTFEECQQDIQLLQMLNPLELQPAQMQQLLAIASDVQARRDEVRQVEDSEEVLAIALQIRQALLEGKQGADLQQLQASMAPFSREHGRREQALQQALQNGIAQALALLDDQQIDAIIREGAGGRAARLGQIIAQARRVPPAEFDRWLAQVSHDIAVTLASGNVDAAGQAQGQIRDLAKRVREMNDADFEAQADLLRQEAARIAQGAAEAEPDEQWREMRLREALRGLLTHPRFPSVIKARLELAKAAG